MVRLRNRTWRWDRNLPIILNSKIIPDHYLLWIYLWEMSKVSAVANKIVKLPAIPSRQYSTLSTLWLCAVSQKSHLTILFQNNILYCTGSNWWPNQLRVTRGPSSPAGRTKHSVGSNQSIETKSIPWPQSVVNMIIILVCYGWQPRERSERSSRKTRSATSVCGRSLSRHELFYKSYNDEHLVPHLNSNMKKIKPRYFFSEWKFLNKKWHKKYHFAEKPKSAIFSSNSIGEKSYDFLKFRSPFGTWSSNTVHHLCIHYLIVCLNNVKYYNYLKV